MALVPAALTPTWTGGPPPGRHSLRDVTAITDNEYTRALRAYQKKAWCILNKPEVWRAVIKVAEALLDTRRLTDAEARAAIAEGCIRLWERGDTWTYRP